MLTFLTCDTSIISMSITEIDHANASSRNRAVYKSLLATSTEQVIQPDGTSSLTKEGIETRNCSCKIGKVLNNNHGMQFQQSKPAGEYPSCLQATLASLVDQKPSQTVPHVSFQQSSTRPSSSVLPPRSLRSPLLQSTGIEGRC
jgi:hypothetical protein